MADKSEVTVPETEANTVLTPKHIGFGKYEVDGQKFGSKGEAERYIASLQRQQDFENEHGDVLPEGYDIKITDMVYEYRGSLMELAMNELYAPDGSHNPFYDREWVWSWAAHDRTDIADKQAKGYKLVDLPTLTKGVTDERYPPHILNLVREEGSYLVYGDSVLMRMPRVLWRQRQAAKAERTLRFFKDLDNKQRAQFDNAGVGIGNTPASNELQIKL